MPQPRISRKSRSWKHFQEVKDLLITEALLILRKRTDLVKDEKDLNRLLRRSFREALFHLKLDYLPSLDAENDKGNRPDLSWNFYNDLATTPEECELCFALECKRLGRKTDSGWEFNEQYVSSGILRFFNQKKGYGEGVEIGAIIGYVQDSEFTDILQEVNEKIATLEPSIPALSLSPKGWQIQAITNLVHSFQRPPLPLAFHLQHFWLDMRDCTFLTQASATPNIDKKEALEQPVKKQKNKARNATRKKNSKSVEFAVQQRLSLEIDAEVQN